MKKKTASLEDDLRPEYRREDLGKGVRGKYYAQYLRREHQDSQGASPAVAREDTVLKRGVGSSGSERTSAQAADFDARLDEFERSGPDGLGWHEVLEIARRND